MQHSAERFGTASMASKNQQPTPPTSPQSAAATRTSAYSRVVLLALLVRVRWRTAQSAICGITQTRLWQRLLRRWIANRARKHAESPNKSIANLPAAGGPNMCPTVIAAAEDELESGEEDYFLLALKHMELLRDDKLDPRGMLLFGRFVRASDSVPNPGVEIAFWHAGEIIGAQRCTSAGMTRYQTGNGTQSTVQAITSKRSKQVLDEQLLAYRRFRGLRTRANDRIPAIVRRGRKFAAKTPTRSLYAVVAVDEIDLQPNCQITLQAQAINSTRMRPVADRPVIVYLIGVCLLKWEIPRAAAPPGFSVPVSPTPETSQYAPETDTLEAQR